MPLVDFPQHVDHLHRSHSLLADGPSSSPAGHRGMPLRALSDELIEEIVKAYLDRTCADDPLALCAAPLTELGPILYGRDRCGPGGAADDDRRLWKHACAKLGLPALPTYQGAPTTWRAAFRALCAEVSQLSDDGRDSFRRLVWRRPYSVELLFQAALHGHAIVVAVILAHAPGAAVVAVADDAGEGITVLLRASISGHAAVASQLLAAGTDVDTRSDFGDRTSLMWASEGDHLETVQVLLAARADVHARNNADWTPLGLASNNGHPAVAEALLAAGADVDGHIGEDDDTALMLASRNWRGNLAVVRVLLAASANVNAGSHSGWTALMRASDGCQHGIVQVLLAASADVNARTNDKGWTALMRASYRGHLEIVLALLAANADVNAHDNDRMTALMFAVDDGHANVARHLLAVDGIEVPTGVRTRIVELLRKADDQLLKKAGVKSSMSTRLAGALIA